MRKVEIERRTAETDIRLSLDLDGSGSSIINTGCGFLDHMLTLFARHGRFDLEVQCQGDTEVDDHHTVEDIGICLGQAFAKALGQKKGIVRYGDMLLPMDEALILAAVDISGRGSNPRGLQAGRPPGQSARPRCPTGSAGRPAGSSGTPCSRWRGRGSRSWWR